MPLYKNQIIKELEKKTPKFTVDINKEAIQKHKKATKKVENFSIKDINRKLAEYKFPGALPTKELERNDNIVIPFEKSSKWSCHQDVNDWAKNKLENLYTIAADGSQIDPVSEYEKPIGLVQVVWIVNKHSSKGNYKEDIEAVVLTPEELLFEDSSGYIKVDDQEVPATRFEKEMKVLQNQIEKYSEKDDPPVVIYDGSLILSFIETFRNNIKERYIQAMSKLLAASKYNKVPVVGYISGSSATELGNMIRKLGLVDTNKQIRDHKFLEGKMENWGDRTVLFSSHRGNIQNKISTEYKNKKYDFSQDILFTYLNVGPGSQMDRIELPRWILENNLEEYVISLIRAEAGVGRGYPEILQTVDADAVISHKDREEFLRICQDFLEKKDINMHWKNKDLSKKRRRR